MRMTGRRTTMTTIQILISNITTTRMSLGSLLYLDYESQTNGLPDQGYNQWAEA